MGYWGVKSYENDDAADALDAGFGQVHGASYDALMEDSNPLAFDDVQRQLADPDTLAASLEALRQAVGPDRPLDDWDDHDRLAFAGIVVRHAEFGVAVPDEWLDQALDWLRDEPIEWDEATIRRLRRQQEIALLEARKAGP